MAFKKKLGRFKVGIRRMQKSHEAKRIENLRLQTNKAQKEAARARAIVREENKKQRAYEKRDKARAPLIKKSKERQEKAKKGAEKALRGLKSALNAIYEYANKDTKKSKKKKK